jgi:hypothetical protein
MRRPSPRQGAFRMVGPTLSLSGRGVLNLKLKRRMLPSTPAHILHVARTIAAIVSGIALLPTDTKGTADG